MKSHLEVTKHVITPVLYITGYLVILLFLLNFLTNVVRGERNKNNLDQQEIKITLNKAE